MNKFDEFLINLDSLTQQIDELEIFSMIEQFANKEYGENNIPEKLRREIIAFHFRACPDGNKWGTYYGPMSVINNVREIPSISDITPSMVDYWKKRADKSENPILKTRYADLVWDFSEKIREEKPDYKIANTIIENSIEISNNDLHKYQHSTVEKLERALSLALSLKNEVLIERVKVAIMAYEDKITKSDKPERWGFSFDLLIKNKNVKLNTEEKNKIIQDLEQRLEKLSKSSDNDISIIEGVALRLADYYRALNDEENKKRVILVYGKKVEETVNYASSAIQKTSWLEKLFNTYSDYGLKEESNNISIKIERLSNKIHPEFNKKEISVEISFQKIEESINILIKGDIEAALGKFAIYFIPDKNEVIRQIDDLSNHWPFPYLINKKLVDESGRVVSTIPPLQNDPEGHIVHQITQNMAFISQFLHSALEKLINKFNLDSETIVDFLYRSPIFVEDKKDIIKKGIEAYLNKDFIVALHILIRQIEPLIRNIEKKTGGAILKSSRSGGFNYKTLDDMLRDENVNNALNENTILYLKTLLTDSKGLNLRNNVCHGISNSNILDSFLLADRVFHVIICLSIMNP